MRRIARLAGITLIIIAVVLGGITAGRAWITHGVSNNVLLDQQTRIAQDNLKRTKAFLELERRKRLKAEANAAFYQRQAASYQDAANARQQQRQRDLVEHPAPAEPAAAAAYWKGKYDDVVAENRDLRTSFTEQMKVTAMFQQLYVSAQRDLANIGDASTGVSTALEDEHNARQCKVLGLVSCPSRGAMFAAGVVTTVVVKLLVIK